MNYLIIFHIAGRVLLAEAGLLLLPLSVSLLKLHPAPDKWAQQGTAITPGSGERSRLLRVLTGQGKPKMPPEDNEAPKPEHVAILKAWIDAGAKGPSGKAPDPTAIVVPHIARSRRSKSVQ